MRLDLCLCSAKVSIKRLISRSQRSVANLALDGCIGDFALFDAIELMLPE